MDHLDPGSLKRSLERFSRAAHVGDWGSVVPSYDTKTGLDDAGRGRKLAAVTY